MIVLMLVVSSGVSVSAKTVRLGVPLYRQYDTRWGGESMGDGTIQSRGCGVVCLSMVNNYYAGKEGEKLSPSDVLKACYRVGYLTSGGPMEQGELVPHLGKVLKGLSVGDYQLGESEISKKRFDKELEKGRPILCVVGKGEFTTSGHYILVIGREKKDGVDYYFVNNPNNYSGSGKNEGGKNTYGYRFKTLESGMVQGNRGWFSIKKSK